MQTPRLRLAMRALWLRCSPTMRIDHEPGVPTRDAPTSDAPRIDVPRRDVPRIADRMPTVPNREAPGTAALRLAVPKTEAQRIVDPTSAGRKDAQNRAGQKAGALAAVVSGAVVSAAVVLAEEAVLALGVASAAGLVLVAPAPGLARPEDRWPDRRAAIAAMALSTSESHGWNRKSM